MRIRLKAEMTDDGESPMQDERAWESLELWLAALGYAVRQSPWDLSPLRLLQQGVLPLSASLSGRRQTGSDINEFTSKRFHDHGVTKDFTSHFSSDSIRAFRSASLFSAKGKVFLQSVVSFFILLRKKVVFRDPPRLSE